MSRETVLFFINRLDDAITKEGNNSKFPLKSMFLKIKEDLDNIPIDDLSQEDIDEVRDSVYDLEDMLSECQALLKKRNERMPLMKCYSPKEFFYLNKTKIRLRNIEKVLQRFRKEKMSPSHNPRPSESQTEYEWSYGAVDISKIHGWDDDVNKISKALLKEGDGFNMVGIVGNFGTGKTALAQKIFMSEDVMDTFCLRLWVCVSPNCERKELVWRMLDNLGVENVQSILDEKGDRDELGILLFMLHLQLQDKRYLIVFDDIWEADDWHTSLLDEPPETREWTDRLAYGLPKGNGSAIIVTSRVHEVARKMVGRMHIYQPTRILDENGWKLFKTAYEEVRPFDESLESMKSEIIIKCDGLPLALQTAGRELAALNKIADTSNMPNIDDTAKPEVVDDSKPQADEKDEAGDGDSAKPQVDNNSNPQAHEEGEAEDGDSANPLAEDIKEPNTDEIRKQRPTNGTGKSKPQDDDTSELNAEDAEKSMQLEEASRVSKTNDALEPSDDGIDDTKDTNESHISSSNNNKAEVDNSSKPQEK